MTHAPAARYRVDATHHTVVTICLVPGCGARWLTGTRLAGFALLAEHVELNHPGFENVPARRRRAA